MHLCLRVSDAVRPGKRFALQSLAASDCERAGPMDCVQREKRKMREERSDAAAAVPGPGPSLTEPCCRSMQTCFHKHTVHRKHSVSAWAAALVCANLDQKLKLAS